MSVMSLFNVVHHVPTYNSIPNSAKTGLLFMSCDLRFNVITLAALVSSEKRTISKWPSFLFIPLLHHLIPTHVLFHPTSFVIIFISYTPQPDRSTQPCVQINLVNGEFILQYIYNVGHVGGSERVSDSPDYLDDKEGNTSAS